MQKIMADVKINKLEDKVSVAFYRLRATSFNKNLPFLILSDKLPEGQAYREYADGRIEIHEVHTRGANLTSKLIKKLSKQEADKVRTTYGLQ
ncbi:hypothetical protein GO495_17335 [Chitinophaga oryziterrae]|uniref:Uncharacterized protein n=1 Tax=Chitinophaga oryziterrae TaxID=1031224 RepID=A0A6N8JDK7_9BACT|nr:hypothetical protein [Chitinophaga oryziterrae]MVT42359.1 hypothetical protein [Chitinophaga oryziterrae]